MGYAFDPIKVYLLDLAHISFKLTNLWRQRLASNNSDKDISNVLIRKQSLFNDGYTKKILSVVV